MRKKTKTNIWEKTFSIGYTCACANMLRNFDQPTMVEECFDANFMDVKTMKAIGVDEGDIEVLMPIILEIERKRILRNELGL